MENEAQPHTPIVAAGPPPAGPWKWFTARILLPVGLALLIVFLLVIHFVGLLFSGPKETSQEAAQRKASQQYEQTTPASPTDVAGFAAQTKQAAKNIGTTAANLGNLVNQGLTGDNPLAVPGNPNNTSPIVYKAWVDANAASAANAPGYAAPGGPAPSQSGSTGNGEGSAASAAEERLEAAKKRQQQRLAASSMAIDFTKQASAEKAPEQQVAAASDGPAKTEDPNPFLQAATPTQVAEAPALQNTEGKERTEPYNVKLHTCIDLCEGDLIETVLTNRIDGAQAGFADVMVTQPVYSHDWDPQGRRLLIPVGSRVLGNVTAVNSANAQRLFVAFHKVRRPDGSTFSLDNFTGLDMAGASGLKDLVNHHYFAIFGASLAIAAIGGVAEIGNTSNAFSYDPSVALRQGASQQLGQESMQILNRFLNQPPTMVVRQGRTLVKVYISQDLNLPAYLPKELQTYVSQR